MPNSAELLPFQKLQFAFTATIRDPAIVPGPADVEPRRMAIYQELLYNNVEGFISSCFPLVRRLYDDANWHALVRNYFSLHRAATPLFLQMPREFLHYLQHERAPHAADPPCLSELALFDWQKLALDISDEAISLRGVDPHGDLFTGIPVLSPLLQLHAYQFPVQRITPDFQPTQPDATPTYLLLYRDLTDEVHTLEVNALTAHLISQLADAADITGGEILDAIAKQLQHLNPEVVMQGGLEILKDLRAREVILGTRLINKSSGMV